jgi:tetratricopeptide (TPR) repeat protein
MRKSLINAAQRNFAALLCVLSAILFGGLFGCWLRILDAMAGRTPLTLAVFTAVALTAALCGATISIVLRRNSRNVFSVDICFVLLITSAYQLFLLHAAPGMSAGWQQLLLEMSRNYTMFLKLLLKSSLIFIALFSFLAGGLYAQRIGRTRGSSLMIAVAVITGFFAGCWLFAIAIPSASGFELPLCLLAALPTALAATALFSSGTLQKMAALTVSIVAVLVFFYAAQLPLNNILARGTFGRLVYRDSGFAFANPSEEHIAGKDIIAIYDDRDYQFVCEMNNRPVIFGNRFHTTRVLNGYIPLLIQPASERVLLVGGEAGLFAPFLLRGGVATPAYCDANPRMVELLMHRDALASGKTATEEHFKKLVRQSFTGCHDLIVLTPEPLFKRGCTRGFSQSRLRRIAAMLEPGGVAVLHLDARALARTAFATILDGMRQEFAHMQVWCTGTYEWMVAGSMYPLTLNVGEMLKLFERDAVFRDFILAGQLTMSDALACMVCDETGVDRWLAENPERISYRRAAWNVPKNVLEGDAALMSPVFFEKVRQLDVGEWLHRGEAETEIYSAIKERVENNITARISAVMALANVEVAHSEKGLECARDAAQINPDDAFLVQFQDALELEGRRRIAIGDYKGAVRCYENILTLNRESAQAYYGLGYCLRANGDLQSAYLHFARAVVNAPRQRHYRIELAGVALEIGQYSTADLQYEKILEDDPNNITALLLYAEALLCKGRENRRLEKAIELAQRACELTQWKNPDIIVALADIYIEAGRVMEGMGLKRRLKEEGANFDFNRM